MAGFNPMQMFGQMMGGGNNPLSGIMGGSNPMQQMLSGGGLPFSQGQVNGMNPQQIMNMANQLFGGKAPSQNEIQQKMNELKSQGKVMVINNHQLYQMIQQGGGGDVVRFANIPNPTIMTIGDYDNLYGGK